MKRRVWVSSPVFFIITAVMFLTAGLSWFYSSFVFYVEIALAFLATAAVALATSLFRSYVSLSVKAAKKVLTEPEYEAIQGFSMATALVGEEGDIIWANGAFLKNVNAQKECRGENILRFLYPVTLSDLTGEKGADVSLNDREYTVYGIRTEKGYVLYFVDTTYYRGVEKEFAERHPVAAILTFDNREELARDASGNEDARLAAEVETVLRDWAPEMGGFLKKLSGGRFLLMTDEAHVRQAAEKRFEILDKVRGIKLGENRSATVSIGIGRGASTLQESDLWARQALDMALGRGGDQVAIKQKDDSYQFFGGLSKGVEKRDKVRTRVIAATLTDHIKNSDLVLIMGHRYSDLDCIGSAVGMWSVITKGLNKQAFIVVNREQSLAQPLIDNIDESIPDRDIFVSPDEATGMMTPKTLLIVVDTHSQDFVESAALLNMAQRLVVIDHHRMMVRHIDNAIVFYHEPYASSTSEMVAELLQYINEKTLSQLEAEALLAGIMLDTKNFVLKTGVRTFEAAAYLRRRGADTVEVKRLFSDPIATYKAKYKLVSGAEIYNNCAIACAEEEIPDIRIASAQAADELLSIQGVSASFVIFPTENTVNISARSLGDVNVQIIMEAMGGGGHLTMAAAQIKDISLQEARDHLVSVLNDTLPQASKLSAGAGKN